MIEKTIPRIIFGMFCLTLFTLMPTLGFSQMGTHVIDLNYENGNFKVLNMDKTESLSILDPGVVSEGEFLLIRSGIKVWNKTSRLSSIYFSLPTKKTQICQIENPITPANFQIANIEESSIEKFNLLRNCLNYKVEDPQKGLLEFPDSQLSCEIKRINESSVLISGGGDCFFKSKQGQRLNLEIMPFSKCTDRSFLVENKISPLEIISSLQTFIYPKDHIGIFFQPKQQLFEKMILMNLNAGKELLINNQIEDNDGNSFIRPGHFILPEFMISDLAISNEDGNRAKLDLKFLLSTYGKNDSCVEGLCSNYLNYDIPFVPLLTLKEINSRTGKGIEIQSNFIGDRIPPKWNGEFSSRTYFRGIQFEAGKKYSIELIFSDPTGSYQELKNNYKSLFKLGSMNSGNFMGETTFGNIRSFSGITTNTETIPDLLGISPGLNFHREEGSLGDIPRIVQTFMDPTFPPQYSKVCNKDLSVCNNPFVKEHLKVTINFDVKNIDGAMVVLGDEISIERSGNLYPSYKGILDLKNKPTIKCSNK